MTWEAGDQRPVPAGGLVVQQDPAVSLPHARIRVAGELDPATAPLLTAALTNLLQAHHLHVDLDLSSVTFCDSSGLHAMVEAREALRARGGTVTLHDPCRSLGVLLDFFGLTRTLDERPPTEPDPSATGGGAASVPSSRAPQDRPAS